MKDFRSYISKLDLSANTQPCQFGSKQAYRALFASTLVVGTQLLSVLAASANPVPSPGIPSPLLPTRIILNPSFEETIVTTWNASKLSSTMGSASANVAGGNIREAYNESAANPNAKPIIWRSTETGGTRSQYGYSDAIEVWRGTPGSGGPTATSGAGVQYAELNGSANASLYQDLCIMPSENVSWSLRHTARINGSVSNPTNIMQVSITDPTLWSGKTPPTAQASAYYSALSASAATTAQPYIATSYSQGWKSYSGSWTSTNTNPKLLRFAFGAIKGSESSVGGTPNNTFGNFIDNVQLSLPALIDFLGPEPTSNVNLGTHTEGSDPNNPNYYYLSLRINGNISTSGKVRIQLNGLNSGRGFRIGNVLKGSATVSGLSAAADGNKIMLDIPAGTYNPNLPADYIHIPIDFSDKINQTNDRLIFTLDGVESGALTTKSTRCSTDILRVETDLIDDDPKTFYKKVERPVRVAKH